MRSFFAVPTQTTMDRLQSILQSAPITLNFQQMVVPLALNTNIEPTSTGSTFAANVISFGHFYNEELGHSQMVAVLQSPDLVKRATELGAGPDYEPHWIIQNSATPLARTNKFWLRSVETVLVSRENHLPFTFTERVVDA